ncbi:MAG: hypothetical protein ACR2PT_23790 [Endozoicomonas sp.]
MPPVKKSVMLSEASHQFLLDRTREGVGVGWSENVNFNIRALRFLIQDNMPALTVEQWRIILNTYNGISIESDVPPYRIASDMMDHYGVLELSELKNDDIRQTVRTVHGFTQSQQFAILDVVLRFWCADWKMKDLKEGLDELTGGKVVVD